MRCERCGRAHRGASWYCGHCGAAIVDFNVADSVRRRPLAPAVMWAVAASLVSVTFVLLAVGAFVALRGKSSGTASAPAGATGAAAASTLVTSMLVPPSRFTPTLVPPRPAATPATGSLPVQPPRRSPARASPTPVPPTPYLRAGATVWHVPRLVTPPSLDGRAVEWSGRPRQVTAVIFGHDYWSGSADLSARAFGAWDDARLYLAVEVTDDLFAQPSTAQRLHLGDSLELQLDVDLIGDAASPTYSADDWQIGLSPGDFAARPPEAYVWRPAGASAGSIAVAARRAARGYTVEAAVPWTVVGFDPFSARSLGLALNVSDDDDPRPAQLTMISIAPSRSWSDPRSFAIAVLDP